MSLPEIVECSYPGQTVKFKKDDFICLVHKDKQHRLHYSIYDEKEELKFYSFLQIAPKEQIDIAKVSHKEVLLYFRKYCPPIVFYNLRTLLKI